MARLCSPQDYLSFSWDVQSYCAFAATCCYRRLNVIERAITHASLAFFSFIAGLRFTFVAGTFSKTFALFKCEVCKFGVNTLIFINAFKRA